ncbi:MAG: 3-oxoacyl-ACP reductase FabG [Halobacteriovoraceae bacterium]|nr:3-oxoacyl-ACP reductase FabG [Halobacteriovoraceae bacterium]
MKFDFTGQVVIVTGGTRGIGRGISEKFLESGAKVIATYSDNVQAAESFKISLGPLSDNLTLKKFDISNKNEVEDFYNWINSATLTVNVLVNNGGIRKDGLIAIMQEEDWDKVIDTNLKGTYLMTKGAVAHFMQNRYGRIINMSSVSGNLGLAGQANYAASKAGQVALSKSVAKEVGKRGITINNVLPGFIETELINDLPMELVKEYKKQVPLKRFGQIDEVAAAVLFLASKEASYITGATLEISGGL